MSRKDRIKQLIIEGKTNEDIVKILCDEEKLELFKVKQDSEGKQVRFFKDTQGQIWTEREPGEVNTQELDGITVQSTPYPDVTTFEADVNYSEIPTEETSEREIKTVEQEEAEETFKAIDKTGLKKGDKVILHTEKVNKIEDLVFKPDIHKEFQDFMKQADKTGTVERIKVNGKEVDEFFGYGNKTFDIIYVDVKFGSNIIKRIPGYALEKIQ